MTPKSRAARLRDDGVEPARPAQWVVDIISRLKEQRPHMRPAERRVAEAVLEDVAFAVRASNADLAQRAGVSEPTVTRFCRTLGCAGVRDFKLKLAQSLVVGTSFFQEPTAEGAEIVAAAPFWSAVFHHAHEALSLAEQQLDRAALANTVTRIAAAKRVIVFGVGGGATVLAEDTEYRLFRLGLAVSAYSDGHLMRMVASTLGADDVVIAISASGHPPEVIESVRIARQYRVFTIAVTKPDSALSEATDLALTVSVPETTDVLKPTASRYAFMAVIDLIAAGTAYHLGHDAQESLRRIKYNLMNFRSGEVLEPLGD